MNPQHSDDQQWLAQVLPIIRLREFRRFGIGPKRREIVALYPHTLLTARVDVRTQIPESAYDSNGDSELISICQQNGRASKFTLAELEEVSTHRRSLLFQVDTIHIRGNSQTRVSHVVSREHANLYRAFSLLLGERYTDHPRPSFLRVLMNLTPFLVLLVATYLYGLDGPFATALFWLVIVAFVFGVAQSIPGRRIPKPRPKRRPTKDLSGRDAVRLRIAGKVLASAGAAFVIAWLAENVFTSIAPALSADGMTRLIRFTGSAAALFVLPCLVFAQYGRTAIFLGLLGVVVQLLLGLVALLLDPTPELLYSLVLSVAPYLGLLLIQLGRSLQVRSADYDVQVDDRLPILYLRAFEDDVQDTLTPQHFLANLFGLAMPDPVWRLPVWQRAIFEVHPYRLIRSLIGQTPQTTEMQLAAYFRRFGPFIAIGEPGEWLSPEGASRKYVHNDVWQQEVMHYMDRAQFVVLQAARSEGFLWEVKITLQRVPAEKVLFCLSNFRNRQNDYEDFRIHAESCSGWKFPRSVGNHDEPKFLFFDETRTPLTHDLSYLSPIQWAFRGAVGDLDHTLQAFVSRDHHAPYKPRTFHHHVIAAILIFLTVVPAVWVALLTVTGSVVEAFTS